MVSGWEGVVLLLIVLLVVGPDKLPEIAGQLAGWARTARDLLREARTSLKDEFGEDLSDLRSLDPRQYDPRRIVREALMEDTPAGPARPSPATRPSSSRGATPSPGGGEGSSPADGEVPFDSEAT